MQKLSFLLAAFTLFSCSHPVTRQVAFVSKRASEATLTFSHFVELESATKPTRAEAKQQVELQVEHMFGPMERADVTAAPKEDHTIKVTAIEEHKAGIWRISYDYSGILVLESGPRTKYKFLLPVNPDKIYLAGFSGGKNLCTDEHYQTEGDFWYFWSPAGWGKNEFPNCKLKSNQNGEVEDGEDYELITGTIERFEKDRTTYPEYDRLAHNGVIDIHFFYGKDEEGGETNPHKSKDLNAKAYREAVKALTDKESGLGYKLRRWTQKEISKVYSAQETGSEIFVEEAVKEFPNGIKLRARFFFGETGIGETSAGFHYFFRDALKNSSVMIYNGHSGLGGHLDLAAIAEARGFRITPNKKRYQIYFFNSCTSYTYYNATYLQRKRSKKKSSKTDAAGTKNLDIMANGLATYFDIMHDTDMAVLKVIDLYLSRGTWTSYQRMAREIDSDNLFTVNGDEDNPTERR